jgi:hypothetical protein
LEWRPAAATRITIGHALQVPIRGRRLAGLRLTSPPTDYNNVMERAYRR